MAKRKIQLADRTVEGTELAFTISRDAYLELLLEDGAVLNLKPVVLQVYKTNEKSPDGERLYVVMNAVQVSVKEPGKGEDA
jgi:hypothetical protein